MVGSNVDRSLERLREEPSREWLTAFLTPMSIDEMLEGAVGLLRLRGETWAEPTRGMDPSTADPVERHWMEAIALDGEDVLVYPNDPRIEPEITVYAPFRFRGPRSFLFRLALVVGERGEIAGSRLETDSCTPMIEGELREREVVCVETGCPRNCTRSFFRKDGVEIIECSCGP